ncbi:hypothetical protein XAP6164_2580008 [Xanthomonas phaseoli pv. phaseoli]|nr:hypothetical protein XAP6164_2580008 [Xanthomonas phaseoli pv. phaseoli]
MHSDDTGGIPGRSRGFNDAAGQTTKGWALPKGLISASCYYRRTIDAGATVPGAKNALFSGRFVGVGARCAHIRSLYVRIRCDEVAQASRDAARRIGCPLVTAKMKTAAPVSGDRTPTSIRHSQRSASNLKALRWCAQSGWIQRRQQVL